MSIENCIECGKQIDTDYNDPYCPKCNKPVCFDCEHECQEYDISTLHELGIFINSKKGNLDHLLSPRTPDICMCEYCNTGRLAEKFKAILDETNEKLTGEMISLIDRAKQITMDSGKKKIVFKGIGTFIFNKNKAKVDDSEYLEFNENELWACHKAYPHLFKTDTTIKPIKKEILETIKEGDTVDGFRLTGESHTFKFKQ